MANVKLTITVLAEYVDGIDDPYIDGDADVTKIIELVMPYVDPKFVSMPKVIEGVTIEALAEHRQKLASLKAAADARRPGPLWQGMTLTKAYPADQAGLDDVDGE